MRTVRIGLFVVLIAAENFSRSKRMAIGETERRGGKEAPFGPIGTGARATPWSS